MLSYNQISELADILLHQSHPKAEPLVKQPKYIKDHWISEAHNAVDVYNVVHDYLNLR